ncbi:hypothetical protein Tco_0471804 [Tanacetum coccineum]
MKTQDELRSEKKQALAIEDPEQGQPIDAELIESDFESSKLETESIYEASAEESDESDKDNKETTDFISKRGPIVSENSLVEHLIPLPIDAAGRGL